MIDRFRYFAFLILPPICLALLLGLAAQAMAADEPAATQQQAELLGVLKSDAPAADKALACKRLALCGDKEAVPALAALLDDEQLASWARIALEVIPDPAADAALRQAAGKLQGRRLIGVINSLAVRRDAKAVDLLIGHLKGADEEVAAAAAVALGRIGGTAAQAALEQALGAASDSVRNAAAEGCLLCADRFLKAGDRQQAATLCEKVRAADVPKQRRLEATRGLILARQAAGVPLLAECLHAEDDDVFRLGLGVARELGGPEAAQALIAELGSFEPRPSDAPARLEIKQAVYGAGDRTVDVTDRLRAMIRANTLSVEASNSLAGDPAQGVVKQLRITYTIGGEEKTAVVPEKESIELGQAMAEANPRQVLLIYALGDLGQPAALPVVLDAARRGSWDARLAAVHVLGQIGDASAVPVLLAAAQEGGSLGEAAIESLTSLKGAEVDQGIARGLGEAEGTLRAVLVELVGRRGIRSAAPVLLKDVRSEDAEVRVAAITALGLTAEFEQLDVLIQALLGAQTEAETQAARTALLLACPRMPQRDATAEKLLAALPNARPEAQAEILNLLGVVGGAKALAGVVSAARSSNDPLEDAATEVLGRWMSADAAGPLLELARTGSQKYRIRALRAYIRIARQLDVPLEQRMAMCGRALETAQRDPERALVLEVLQRYPTAAGLKLAASQLGTTSLKNDTARTAVVVAEQVLAEDPAAVAAAMQRVIAAGADPDVLTRAKALLAEAEKGASRQ